MSLENSAELLNFVPEMSTDSICVGDNDTLCLTDHLEAMESDIDGKAPSSHTHTEYADAAHTHDGYAASNHTHDYAASNHTHDGYAATSHTHSDYAAATHTHSDYMTEDDAAEAFAGIDHTHSDYAATDHTHSGYAAASHTHSGYAASSHEHSDYAAATHTHSEYAASSHSHSGYAASGHTHTASEVGAAAAAHTHTAAAIGAASASHSHSEYAASNHGHSGYASSSHTHDADDVGAVPASGGTATNLTVSPYLYTAQILPKDSGSYSIGSSDNRYYSTYLRVNPNVSSDRRCKRDIEAMDIYALAAFVDKLAVVSYNYNDDAADEAKRIGLIAQDVVAADATIAQGCIEQDEKGFYSLRAADLVFPLIAAVQALTKRVEELEGK